MKLRVPVSQTSSRTSPGALGLTALTLALAACAPWTAQAGTLSDSMTVYDGAGNVYASITVSEADEKSGQTYLINKTGPNGIELGNSSMFNKATGLIELGGIPGTAYFYSDFFGVADSSVGFTLGFVSDDELGLFGSPTYVLKEDQAWYDATPYLNPRLQTLGWTAKFVSDTEVPEPATYGLVVGLGLVGFAVRRRLNRT